MLLFGIHLIFYEKKNYYSEVPLKRQPPERTKSDINNESV